MGHGWLNYARKSSRPSGQMCAKLCSKNTVGLYGHKCVKEVLAPHYETTTQCFKRYDNVRLAQVGEQCTSMCGVDTKKGRVISAVLALRAEWTMESTLLAQKSTIQLHSQNKLPSLYKIRFFIGDFCIKY